MNKPKVASLIVTLKGCGEATEFTFTDDNARVALVQVMAGDTIDAYIGDSEYVIPYHAVAKAVATYGTEEFTPAKDAFCEEGE